MGNVIYHTLAAAIPQRYGIRPYSRAQYAKSELCRCGDLQQLQFDPGTYDIRFDNGIFEGISQMLGNPKAKGQTGLNTISGEL